MLKSFLRVMNFHVLRRNISQPIVWQILKPDTTETRWHMYIVVNSAIGKYIIRFRNLFTRPHLASTRTWIIETRKMM